MNLHAGKTCTRVHISSESCTAANPNRLLVPTLSFVLVLELKTRLYTTVLYVCSVCVSWAVVDVGGVSSFTSRFLGWYLMYTTCTYMGSV